MTATLLSLPTADDRKERQLRAAWAKEDALAEQARLARTAARKLEKEVARSLGYPDFIRREALEAGLLSRKAQT